MHTPGTRSLLSFLIIWLALLCAPPVAHAQDIDYFFPEGTQFDASIPSPGEFLGYEIGMHHTRHDRIVAYFRELERLSDRVTVEQVGMTNELRPMIYAFITSPENHARLEELRTRHLELSDPSAAIGGDLADRPIVVQLGYGVHGNETSSSEAAMLQAYHLAAGQGADVERQLREGIFLVEPVLNPDGRDRHTHWANMHKGDPLVADPLDREHNEVWPGGRTNHYWFDLNRDWLPLTQVESQARLAHYHRWMPNVVTDFHEMGTSSTYFFEPTKPEGSWNPLVPEYVYRELTDYFAENWSSALDELGTLYFTEEVYDNSYPGYGSTYPNMQGGIGFVFEQASARGHVQDSPLGEVTFPYTIRNQLRTSLATVETAIERKEELLGWQREFFTSAVEEAEQFPAEAYVFGDAHDATRNRAFLDLLLQHEIEVYELGQELSAGGQTFAPGSAYLVPTEQPQFRMVRTMFEHVTEFADSTFYDTSAWTMALAYGLPHAELENGTGAPQGSRVTAVPSPAGLGEADRARYAYVLDWSDYNAAKALYFLQERDLITLTASEPFEIATTTGTRAYPRGSILVPVQNQTVSADSLHRVIQAAERHAEVNLQATHTGLSQDGIDLGSRNFQPLERPEALMLIGDGMSSYESGQVWHLLDERVDMPITKVDRSDYGRVPLHDYNTLVLVSGRYDFSEAQLDELRRWIRAGGTLIAIRGASQWAVNAGLVSEDTFHPAEDEGEAEDDEEAPERYDYATRSDRLGAQQIGGSIYEVDLDITHPLGYGFHDRSLPVYRDHRNFFPLTRDPYQTVARYTEAPHLAGYVSEENLERIAGSASLAVDTQGRGQVILFADNPNFRGMWYGTNRLFFNALFLGQTL